MNMQKKSYSVKRILAFSIILLIMAVTTVQAANNQSTLVVTASNDPVANQLMVYDTSGNLIQTVPTGGAGGVSGNAGGVMVQGDTVAVVNFGSQSVSIFSRSGDDFSLVEDFSTISQPVSVAFGDGHLYVLGLTSVESHKMQGSDIDPVADGSASLVKADGSAAQVGVIGSQLLITEKSNTVETVDLNGGVASGSATAVTIPAGSNTPFGLTTRGDNGYVTIAHSDEVGVVKNGILTDLISSGTQHAPCWLALSGSYLYSSNSPSRSVSLYKATGNHIALAVPVAATFAGGPTDIAASNKLIAVIDGSSHLSLFTIGSDGSLTLLTSIDTVIVTNGVAIVE